MWQGFLWCPCLKRYWIKGTCCSKGTLAFMFSLLNFFGLNLILNLLWLTVWCRHANINCELTCSCEGNLSQLPLASDRMWGKKQENYVAMFGHTMQKIALHSKLIWSQTDKTVSFTDIILECYCAAPKKSNRGEKLAARNNNVFCLWFCGNVLFTASWTLQWLLITYNILSFLKY